MSEEWNVITRTILPIVSQPSFTGGSGTTGLGNLTLTAFVSPAKPGAVIWGVGPVASFPTATSPLHGLAIHLGARAVGRGPVHARSLGAGRAGEPDLVCSWREREPDAHPVLRELQLPRRLVPDHVAHPDRRLEGRGGSAVGGPLRCRRREIFRIGKLPFNGNVSAYYNAVRPDFGPEWTVRVQLALLLPTSIF